MLALLKGLRLPRRTSIDLSKGYCLAALGFMFPGNLGFVKCGLRLFVPLKQGAKKPIP